MRAPRRRTLRRGGRRAEAPFQGASAALSMATLAGAACVGRHELPCRHTAREFRALILVNAGPKTLVKLIQVQVLAPNYRRR